MIKLMKVGVVVVNFNSGDYLQRCMAALLASDVSLSIAVVDNDSSDESLAGIKELDVGVHSLCVIENEENVGFSRGVNIGLAELDVDLLMLVNPDCLVHPHSLGKLARRFEAEDSIGVVGALVFNEDGTEQRGCRRNEPTFLRSAATALKLTRWFEGVDLTGQDLPLGIDKVDAVSGAAMMMRVDFLNALGGMSEDYFLHCEDLDICRRMRDARHSVLFDPTVSVIHRQGASSGTSFAKVEGFKHQGMMTYFNQHKAGNNAVATALTQLLVWLHFRLKLVFQWVHGMLVKPLAEAGDVEVSVLDFSKPYVLVTGLNSDVGDFVVAQLEAQGIDTIAVSRVPQVTRVWRSVRWLSSSYFKKAPVDDFPVFSGWIHLAPIWTTKSFASLFKRGMPKRVIGLSSTSIEVKAGSGDKAEASVVKKLRTGEQWLDEFAMKAGAGCVVLRPTLIYGGPRNRNINLVRSVVRRLRFFPLVGEGAGKRQPVHGEDIAGACVALLNKDVSGTYNIGGGEVLSYREMVGRVFQNIQRRPRFLQLPLSLIKGVLSVVGRIPRFKEISPQVAERMDRDQVFSNDDAARDFGWKPREFEP